MSNAHGDQQTFAEIYGAAQSHGGPAAEELCSRFLPELRQFIEGQLGASIRRRQEPDDVCQISLMTFVRRLPTFPSDLSESECRSYLFQIAKWTIGDLVRQRVRDHGESAAGTFEPRLDPPTTGIVTREDELAWLRGIIEGMRETYSTVLRSCVVEGKSIDQAAVELGLKRETVKKRLVRAREELRRTLAAEGQQGGSR